VGFENNPAAAGRGRDPSRNTVDDEDEDENDFLMSPQTVFNAL
jgi:hypothetical protein